MNNWIVYLLRCRGGSLYAGITTDLERRIEQHNLGTGGKYTRAHRPCVLVWSESGFSESEAKSEEARIKKLQKKQKEELIIEKKNKTE